MSRLLDTDVLDTIADLFRSRDEGEDDPSDERLLEYIREELRRSGRPA